MCPVCGSQLPDEEAEETAEEPVEDMSTEDLEECPECGKDLTSIPEDMRFVCPQCRVDLEEAIESMGGGSDGGGTDDAPPGGSEPPAAGGSDPPAAGGSERPTAGGSERPTAGGSEPPAASGSAGGTGGQTGGAGDIPDPPGGGGGGGDGPATIGGNDPVPGDDPSSGGGGPEPAAAIGGPAGGDGQPSEVVFEVLGTDVRASDGDTVGSDVRDAIVEGGLPEKKSKYVHREHVRIDQDGGDFYLTKIGPNPVEVNGRGIDRDQRVQIEDGDEVTFSELVTAEVRIE